MKSCCLGSNPNFLDFPDADIIVAPAIQAGRFRVRMPGHALRDLDAAAIGETVLVSGREVGLYCSTRKGTLLESVPLGIITWTLPLVAPTGTVAVI